VNFKFGEWYTTVDNVDSQISGYSVFALPLSYLYTIMVAIERDRLVPLSAGNGFMANVIESIIVDEDSKATNAEKKVPIDEIKTAKRKM